MGVVITWPVNVVANFVGSVWKKFLTFITSRLQAALFGEKKFGAKRKLLFGYVLLKKYLSWWFFIFLAMRYSGLCSTSDRNRRSCLDTFVCFRVAFLCCKNGAEQNEEKNYIASKTASINSSGSDGNILSVSYCCWYIR